MIDPLVECRKLWGGPFNPNFDVCQNLEDTLTKVNHNIYFLSKGIKTRNIGLMFHCFNVSVFLNFVGNEYCNLSSSEYYFSKSNRFIKFRIIAREINKSIKGMKNLHRLTFLFLNIEFIL